MTLQEHALKLGTLAHINIVVDNLEKATEFYQKVFQAAAVQEFPHFRNRGFARSAGFIDNPDQVDVSIRFLVLPTPDHLVLELMQYHAPQGKRLQTPFQTQDLGGVRHIALRVDDIHEAFAHIKAIPEARLISSSPHYKPQQIDPIQPNEFHFFDASQESNPEEKQKMCAAIGNISYFYFIDPFGVQWEFVQGQ